MAIDTKSLTEIITEIWALQAKDAVSPESLGYILQRIVDLLDTLESAVAEMQKALGIGDGSSNACLVRPCQQTEIFCLHLHGDTVC